MSKIGFRDLLWGFAVSIGMETQGSIQRVWSKQKRSKLLLLLGGEGWDEVELSHTISVQGSQRVDRPHLPLPRGEDFQFRTLNSFIEPSLPDHRVFFDRDFAPFADTAKPRLAELLSQVEIAGKSGYLKKENAQTSFSNARHSAKTSANTSRRAAPKTPDHLSRLAC